MIQAYLVLFLVGLALGVLQYDYDDLDLQSRDWLGHFPVLPPPRTTRQAPGGTFICVPAGTCITATAPGGIGIDPRIVTPGFTTPPPPPASCPVGQVACYATTTAPLCGQRYVTNVNPAAGPATYGAYPWQAFIRNQTSYTGSGVLLDSTTVLTAAHKVNLNVQTPGSIQVYMGVHDPATTLLNSQMRTAVQIILHPQFNSLTLFNDLAIIKLSAPISLGYQLNIATACLPLAGSSFIGNPGCMVSGWGQTAFGRFDAPTSPQKQVNMPIVSYATCRASMSQPTVLGPSTDTYLDPVGELCAGGAANSDACTQDGGAPLVCPDAATGRWNVVGLVIWGKGCGRPGVYGVYVDITKYLTWIQQYLGAIIG